MRDNSIDLCKVLCTLWIVGVLHLSNYGDVFSADSIPLHGGITMGAMSCFMFYSGYCLSKYTFNTFADVVSFYKKRIYRFYFLYLISIIALYIGGCLSPKPWFESDIQALTAALGISSFQMPRVGTLWFLSMLMLFYWITPLLCLNKKDWVTTVPLKWINRSLK